MSRPNAPWYRKVKDTWYIKIDGKLTSLGVRGKGNESAAWAAFQKVLASRTKPLPEGSELLTVRDAVGLFFVACESGLKPKTVTRYRYDVGVFAESHGGDLLRDVTPDRIRLWVSKIKGTTTTKAIMLRSVSAFLGWCVREEKLDRNPVEKVTRPRTASRSDTVLISPEDHQKLLAGATPQFKEVLHVLHGTGCRPGEVPQITAESFNFDARAVVIVQHKTDRTGKPRVVFLLPELAELLRKRSTQYPTGSLLRSRKGVPWSARSITQAMRKLKKKVGVKAIAYGYRHSFITDGLKRGISNAQMAALVGHTSTAVIDKFYSHLGSAGDALRAALKFREGE